MAEYNINITKSVFLIYSKIQSEIWKKFDSLKQKYRAYKNNLNKNYIELI